MVKIFDFIGDSISEFFDVIVYTIFLTYIFTFIVREYYDISYILFPVVPLFVVYVPYIYRQQRRLILELIIKTILYLLISLIIFAISYAMFVSMFSGNVTFIGITFLILFSVGLIRWVMKTLEYYSKEKEFVPYKDRKTSKTKLISFLLALLCWGFTFGIISGVNESGYAVGYSILIYYLILIFSIILSLIMTSYFLVSLFDRRQ